MIVARVLKDLTEPELRRYMEALAKCIGAVLPPGTLFALVVFGRPGVTEYVGNGLRADVIRAMRQCADRLERGEDAAREP